MALEVLREVRLVVEADVGGHAGHRLSFEEPPAGGLDPATDEVFAIALVGTFLPEDVPRPVAIALLTAVTLVVVGISFTIWAAGGSALARFVDDDGRRRTVSLALAALIVAWVASLWV